MDSSLISAFLHLMHLPTINRIDLSYIYNFPPPSLTPAVNLLRLDIYHLSTARDVNRLERDDSELVQVIQSEMIPKFREFCTSDSSLLTTKLLSRLRSMTHGS